MCEARWGPTTKTFLRRENQLQPRRKNAVRDTRGASEAHPETLRQRARSGCRVAGAGIAPEGPLHQSSGRRVGLDGIVRHDDRSGRTVARGNAPQQLRRRGRRRRTRHR